MKYLPTLLYAVGFVGSFLLLISGRWLVATLQELKDALASVQSGVDGLEQAITDLKAQVGAGSPVTQADLDELFASVQAIGADISDPADQG